MEKLIIHHHDWDGIAAAWAIISGFHEETYELWPTGYKEPPPDVKDREVWIVDFSYPREMLLLMQERAAGIVVLDHHKSAAKALEGLDFCTFDMNKSGARLAWEYMHGEAQLVSPFIAYVEDRDLWRFQLPYSNEVNAFIFSYPMTIDSCYAIARILENDIEGAIKMGERILEFRERLVERSASRYSVLELEDVKFAVLNCATNTSEVAHRLIDEHGVPAALWRRNAKGEAHWELRSRDGLSDVSVIATRLGGGGHRNAAGFVVDWDTHNRLLGEGQ